MGYTPNPSPNYNLITEQKNEDNSKKADGAILVDGKVVGVIELKDHKTTNLSQIEAHKNRNKEAVYVVISNFEKLRFYIDNAVDFEEFDLFHLTKEDFARLWICLAYDNIAKDLPKQIKAASVTSEDQITNALYKDYSNFKHELFDDILKNNPACDNDKGNSDDYNRDSNKGACPLVPTDASLPDPSLPDARPKEQNQQNSFPPLPTECLNSMPTSIKSAIVSSIVCRKVLAFRKSLPL